MNKAQRWSIHTYNGVLCRAGKSKIATEYKIKSNGLPLKPIGKLALDKPIGQQYGMNQHSVTIYLHTCTN